ncbi:TPA: sulfatase-like hydrolase/transferase [Neisseria meningitidis]
MDEIQIPKKVELQTKLENEKIVLSKGSTTIIVGANGTGKTRLAVYIEEQLKEKAHRISAHRALKLNPNVNKIPEKSAKTYLSYGQNWDGIDVSNRKNYRWDNNSYTHLLNDFDWLLQYLFAQQNNIAVANNQKLNRNEKVTNSKTKLDILQEAWETLLPHRKLHITADDIQVSAVDNEELYSASNMSDGERALFYILGQVLSVDDGSVLIFDEPELHIHKSIISNLWDKIEELRPDCSFLIITHDIEFAATRVAKKYVIRNYYPTPAWDISEVPESNFDEETITMILGSRKPILFVEGNNNSLDIATYRYCYPDWTIIPKGACKDVIQSVSSLKKLSNEMPLLNLKCSGIVDLDSRDEREIEQLNNLQQGKHFIVLHQRGSHAPYGALLQPQDKVFGEADIVDKYDNTIHKTDQMIQTVFEQLQKQPDGNWLFAYTSDHGQYVRQDIYNQGTVQPDSYLVPLVLYSPDKAVQQAANQAFAPCEIAFHQQLSTFLIHTLGYDMPVSGCREGSVTGNLITGDAGSLNIRDGKAEYVYPQ